MSNKDEQPSGAGSLVGLVVGGFIGSGAGPGGVIFGGLIGALVGNELEKGKENTEKHRGTEIH